MRSLLRTQPWLDFNPVDPKDREKFEILDEILKAARPALDQIMADLTRGVNPDMGRNGMSADQVLRMLIVKQMYSFDYPELHSRVSDSIMLRKFCDYESGWVPKFQTIQENIQKLQPETLEAIHLILIAHAKKLGIEDGAQVRIDTLAIETNIHYPQESTLIHDGVRLLTRMMIEARSLFPDAKIHYHNRTRVVKKRAYAMQNTKATEERVKLYKELVVYAEEVLTHARSAEEKLKTLAGTGDTRTAARAVAAEIKATADLLEKVIHQTRQRVFEGQKVPAAGRVVSLFEPHTDIIEKGDRNPVFGHKVCMTVGRGNLILDAMIERGNPRDVTLFQKALDRQKDVYGRMPNAVAADGGFASAANAEYAMGKGVDKVYFSKSVGRKLRELLPSRAVQRLLFRFRAGVEGVLSSVIRGVGLDRCTWRSWKGFQAYVWAGIIAHNVKMLMETIYRLRRAKLARG